MDVRDIEAIPVAVELASLEDGGIAPYIAGYTTVERATRLLIRLETADGLVGWGETSPAISPEVATKIVEDHLGPRVRGRSVHEVESLVAELGGGHVNLNVFLGGIEMAMWDAFGKRLGAPLYELLGGKSRDEVRVAYCVGILPPDESREHARRARDAGYDALKTKGGLDMDEDVERLVAMHEAVDGELDFRLDANQTWTFDQAVRVGARLEDAGVYLQYLEQPVRVDTFGTYKRLRERLRQPIGPNEDMYYPYHLYHLIKEDALDVGVVDLALAGGISAVKEMASVASNAGVSLAHHNSWDLGVKVAAVAHTAATTPAIDLPYDTTYFSIPEDVVESRHEIDDGGIAVPDDPGLGVAVDEEAVESSRID
jgi:L-alanine-DL-glutamate epimerase-like enolase superfamily enzyme